MNLKFIAILLLLTALLLLTGCSSSESTPDIKATVQAEVKAALTAVPTAIPSLTATQAPTTSPTPTATPIATPTAIPLPVPTLTSTLIEGTTKVQWPKTCSVTVPISEATAVQDTTVAALIARIEDRADPSILLPHRERARAIAQRARQAIVFISPGGTGSLISADGYIITNSHVVADKGSVTVVTFDGRKYQGNVAATVPNFDPDLALVKIDGDNFPFLPLAKEVTIGAITVNVSHPQATYWTSAGGSILGVEDRLLVEQDGFSGLGETLIDGTLWYTWKEVAYSNPSTDGSSGSPLLNCDGEIVAIVYGGGIEAPEYERVSAVYQNKVIWDLGNYISHLSFEHRAVGIESVLAFLSKYAEGLVESNHASRESAITRLGDFYEPSFPVDLCRICVIQGLPHTHVMEYIRANSLEKQIDFLEELLIPKKPRTISQEDRERVLAIGKQIQPAVVRMMRGDSGQHNGTGWFITHDGYIITNAHVVENATDVKIELFDGREYVAEVIGTTFPENQPDLALLKIEAENVPWISLANGVSVGETIIGVGHPHNLEWVIWGGLITYMDPGSAETPHELKMEYQDNAVPVGTGSSGSPIVNLDGKIVGIKNSTATDFTIPSEQLWLRDEWLRPVVIWDQFTLETVISMTPMGIHVDVVRKFVNTQVAGLLD